MQNPSLRKDELRARKIYLYTFYFCAATMLIIFTYALVLSIAEYLSTGKIVIGEVLVDTEFPMTGLAKLVTYLMIVTVVGWYCVTKIGGASGKKITKIMEGSFSAHYTCHCDYSIIRIHLQLCRLEFIYYS